MSVLPEEYCDYCMRNVHHACRSQETAVACHRSGGPRHLAAGTHTGILPDIDDVDGDAPVETAKSDAVVLPKH